MKWVGYEWPAGLTEYTHGHLTFVRADEVNGDVRTPVSTLWLMESQVAEIEPGLLAAGFEKTGETPAE